MLHTVQQCGKANMLSQDFYGEAEGAFRKSVNEWEGNLAIVRLYQVFLRS